MINPSSKANTGQKRTVEEAIPVPTLGQVAEQEDFGPLREHIRPVAGRPVNELGEDLRAALRRKVGEDHELLLASFFGACAVLVEDVATKRAHIAHESRLPGERQRKKTKDRKKNHESLDLVLIIHLLWQETHRHRQKKLLDCTNSSKVATSLWQTRKFFHLTGSSGFVGLMLLSLSLFANATHGSMTRQLERWVALQGVVD
jgi:hypothetical protein